MTQSEVQAALVALGYSVAVDGSTSVVTDLPPLRDAVLSILAAQRPNLVPAEPLEAAVDFPGFLATGRSDGIVLSSTIALRFSRAGQQQY